jgi:sortase A
VLSTCWPFDAVTPGPMRYLLHATLIEDAAAYAQPLRLN